MKEIAELLRQIADTESGFVKLKQGEYILREEDAKSLDLVISNHRNAMCKRAAFSIVGKKDMTIDGSGSKILVDGFLIPVAVTNSCNITLKNFTFDLSEPLFVEGEIVHAGNGFVDIRFLSDRYGIKDGKLFFTVYGKEYPALHIMEFDTTKNLFVRQEIWRLATCLKFNR